MKTITLAGCVILKNNSILLLHRKKRNFYELPGGKVEENESKEAAAIREVKEELLLDVEIIRSIGTTTFQDKERHFHYTWFLTKVIADQTPQINEPEKFDRYKYISLTELFKYKLSPNMQKFLDGLNNNAIFRKKLLGKISFTQVLFL